MINVLIQGRSNLFSKPGGDTTQLVTLKESLTQKNLNADISTKLAPDLGPFDLVHLFNLIRVHDTYLQLTNCRKQKKPVVFSPIYHNLHEYNRKGRHGLGKLAFRLTGSDARFEYARGLFNALRDTREIYPVYQQLRIGYRKQQQSVLRLSDKVIFSSDMEKRLISRHFHNIIHKDNYEIVKTGIDLSYEHGDSDLFEGRYGIKNFVLCVGRIEDLKNQLSLISALKGAGIPLVLVGGVESGPSVLLPSRSR